MGGGGGKEWKTAKGIVDKPDILPTICMSIIHIHWKHSGRIYHNGRRKKNLKNIK